MILRGRSWVVAVLDAVVFLVYASAKGLPASWTKDPERCGAAGSQQTLDSPRNRSLGRDARPRLQRRAAHGDGPPRTRPTARIRSFGTRPAPPRRGRRNDPRTSAQALSDAGAVTATQLDVHSQVVDMSAHAHGPAGQLTSTPLVPGMPGVPDRYLRPDQRDFIAITAR
jgi:hypothetical protein